jgi:hypothetical protein
MFSVCLVLIPQSGPCYILVFTPQDIGGEPFLCPQSKLHGLRCRSQSHVLPVHVTNVLTLRDIPLPSFGDGLAALDVERAPLIKGCR